MLPTVFADGGEICCLWGWATPIWQDRAKIYLESVVIFMQHIELMFASPLQIRDGIGTEGGVDGVAGAVFICGAGDDAVDEGGMLSGHKAEGGNASELFLHEGVAFSLHGLGIMHLVGGDADGLEHFAAGFLAAAEDEVILCAADKGGQQGNALGRVEAVGIAFAGLGEFVIYHLFGVEHIHASV